MTCRTPVEILKSLVAEIEEARCQDTGIGPDVYINDEATYWPNLAALCDEAKLALAAPEAALLIAPPVVPMIIIEMDGGIAQLITANVPVKVCVLDLDIDGADENDLCDIPCFDSGGGLLKTTKGYISGWQPDIVKQEEIDAVFAAGGLT